MKVCPRCSYVDTDGRRVCSACRGSLMGTPARELFEILEMREAALVGAGEPAGRAPWGPGVTALVEEAWNEARPEDEQSLAATSVVPPDAPPRPVRSHGAAATGRFLGTPADEAPVVPAPDPRPSAFEAAFDTAAEPLDLATFDVVVDPVDGPAFETVPRFEVLVADEPAPAEHTPLPGLGTILDVPAADKAADPPQRPQDELAELTRRRLVKLYDARTAAPVLLDVDTPVNGSRPSPRSTGATAGRRARRSRWRVAVAVVLVAAAIAGGGTVVDLFDAGDQGRLADATTPIDKLPWRTVRSDQLRMIAPGAPVGAAGSAYQRYALPDLDLMVTVRDPAPSLTSDVALRSYTSQLASLLGGRLIEGFALVSSEGTGFSARLDVDRRTTLLYVLSAPGAVVEVRGDLLSADSVRAQAIFERTINSIEVS